MHEQCDAPKLMNKTNFANIVHYKYKKSGILQRDFHTFSTKKCVLLTKMIGEYFNLNWNKKKN